MLDDLAWILLIAGIFALIAWGTYQETAKREMVYKCVTEQRLTVEQCKEIVK